MDKTYSDNDWVELFQKGALAKLTVPVLDLFLDKHHLVSHRMNKKQKVEMIGAWLANSEFNRIQQKDTSDDDCSDNNDGEEVVYSADSDDNLDDVVLHEVGCSSDDEQSDGQHGFHNVLLPGFVENYFVKYFNSIITRFFYCTNN